MWKDLYKVAKIVLVVWGVTACQSEQQGHQQNHLINESSPYLLQHAYNPVDWYPWGSQALDKAKAENKLMVISVGYAACHWCHVMEEESFEDSTVAEIMNSNFVSIKVDREERPDVDKIYMDAAFLMSGRGGWPLNVIALPDGRPVFAGTYFPKSDWIKVLNHLMGEFEKDPDRLSELAGQITQGIQQMERVELEDGDLKLEPEFLNLMHQAFVTDIDFKKGGRQGVQKFPSPSIWQYLMKYHYYQKNDSALQAVHTTLKAMARGGIYDHLGGGFARYTVDADWRIPHFEKMLYDNAQLVSLYAQAYQLTGDPLYKKVVQETLAFVDREMKDGSGGFYSSYDADSEGEEGKFYVWSATEMDEVLGSESALISDYYSITEKGNWEEGKNILVPQPALQQFLEKHNLDEQEFEDRLSSANNVLFTVRNKRTKPGLDDKVLTSWSALMATGYIEAYRVLGEPAYLQTAEKTMRFLLAEARTDQGSLNRNYKDGKSSINGFLDDYVHTIQALLKLYEATFDEVWLQEAEALTEYAIEHFFDAESGMFFYTSDLDPQLLARKMELSDNEIPSSNSIMATNLHLLGTYLYQENYLQTAEQMVHSIRSTAVEQPVFYSNWLSLMTQMAQPLYEVAIVGDDWEQKLKEFDQHYLPNVLYLGGSKEGDLELLENKLVEGKTTIYVCQNKSCRLPVNETSQALTQLQASF